MAAMLSWELTKARLRNHSRPQPSIAELRPGRFPDNGRHTKPAKTGTNEQIDRNRGFNVFVSSMTSDE